MLTAHTRKVRTYGKSNTRIVNDQNLFDRVVSPTKYHSPVRNPGRDARGRDAAEVDDEGDEDREEEDDSEADSESEQAIFRSKIGARPAPLSQKSVNHSISQPDFGKTNLKTKGTKVAVRGTSPSAKNRRIRARPQPVQNRPQDQKRVEHRQARGIRSEAQIQARPPISVSISISSTASMNSCSSASTSTSFVSAQSTTLPSTSTTTSNSTEGEDNDGTNVLEADEDTGLDLEPAIEGLRSLRVSSGRFEDAPEDDETQMGTGIDSEPKMDGNVRGSDFGLDPGPGSRSRMASQAPEFSGAESGEDDAVQEGNTTEDNAEPVDEQEEEEAEEEIFLPVLRRRTRKNQHRASRASVGSTKAATTTTVTEASGSASTTSLGPSSLLASDGPRPRRGRGRKVVVTPESSQRATSGHDRDDQAVEPEELDDKTRDLIVVLPPRRTTPIRSPSLAGTKTNAIELVQGSFEALKLDLAESEAKSPLQELLDLCDQPSAPDFSAFLSTHVFGLAEQYPLGYHIEEGQSERDVPAGSNGFRKVGEASYSEVYALVLNDSPTQGKSKAKPRTKGRAGAGKKKQNDPPTRETGLVVKVIPLIEQVKPASSDGGNDEDEAEEDEDEEVACSLVADVKREIEITRLMSGMAEGFVRCHGAYVVQGSYPEILLDAWDEFEDQRGSDSVRPGDLPETQLYALIVLENAGVDLESFEFDKTTGWKQAWGAVMQVVKTLAEGEVKARFEHRDLHEGQVLLRPVENSAHDDPADAAHPAFIGYKATMVDFGLSRVDHPISGDQDPYFTPIPEDVFSGVGDQWDVYRAIRDLVDDESGGNWAGHLPRTNLMWLRHLARVLLHSTRSLKRPRAKPAVKGTTRRPAAAAVSVEPSDNVMYYEKLVDFERTLAEVLEGPTTRPRTRQKRTAKGAAAGGAKLTTMVEFMDLMRTKEWIL